jgi:PAS domain-containing protein
MTSRIKETITVMTAWPSWGKLYLMTPLNLHYQKIFETASDGLIINDLETGLLIEANPAACKMYGYAREEFIGLHPLSFSHPDRAPTVYPVHPVGSVSGYVHGATGTYPPQWRVVPSRTEWGYIHRSRPLLSPECRSGRQPASRR